MVAHVDTLMQELATGTATFEFRNQIEERNMASFFASISSALRQQWKEAGPSFARIASTQNVMPPFAKKLEHFAVHRVKGDGRCMFRALALGMALNEGFHLSANEEREQADNLRMTVMDALCLDEDQRQKYEEALIAITIDESLNRYCQRIRYPDFWGGESELLVLSRIYKQPIVVYIPEEEAKRWASSRGTGFIPIAEYGLQFCKTPKEQKACKPVKLLFSGSNHYDLLV